MAYLNISVLFSLLTLVSSDIDRELSWGFPGGFFSYADRNNDGMIDRTEISNIRNLAWLKIWQDLLQNGSEPAIRKGNAITRRHFMNFLKLRGMSYE